LSFAWPKPVPMFKVLECSRKTITQRAAASDRIRLGRNILLFAT
jgi:hypothetical protein